MWMSDESKRAEMLYIFSGITFPWSTLTSHGDAALLKATEERVVLIGLWGCWLSNHRQLFFFLQPHASKSLSTQLSLLASAASLQT